MLVFQGFFGIIKIFDRKEETGQLKSKIHNSLREGNNEILNKNRRRLVILDFDRRKK